jgi:hypothetical protein
MSKLVMTTHETSDQLLCCQKKPASTQAGGGIAVEEHIPASLPSSPSSSDRASRVRLCGALYGALYFGSA